MPPFPQQEETEAREAGSGSKARRYGRICKQYTDAIRRHQAGKPVPFDELPTPPGETARWGKNASEWGKRLLALTWLTLKLQTVFLHSRDAFLYFWITCFV